MEEIKAEDRFKDIIPDVGDLIKVKEKEMKARYRRTFKRAMKTKKNERSCWAKTKGFSIINQNYRSCG